MHFMQPSSPPPPASAKSAEARRVQSIIEKESGGEAVRALFLVSASGEPKKSQHNTLKNRLQIAAKLAFY